MKNELQIFSNEEFGQVRTLVIDNEPYFVGKDVAELLGYAKPQNAIATHVDEDDTLKQGIMDNLGRVQQTTVINESGLYSLILSSKLPNAKKFKRWVTSEVLPTLRKTGSYILDNKNISSNELLVQVTNTITNFENELSNKLNELDDYYKPTHKNKIGYNSFIKSCLGDNANKENCEKAKKQLLFMLGDYSTYQEVPKDIMQDSKTKALLYDICKNINNSIIEVC